MHYTLTNEQGEQFGVGKHNWRALLAIAEQHDWQAAGTTLPDTAEWDRNYCTKDGQIISVADADALADALMTTLDDLPDVQTMPTLVVVVSDINAPEVYDEARYRTHPVFENRPLSQPLIIRQVGHYNPAQEIPDVLVCRQQADYQPSPVDVWSGESAKNILRQFIAFARGGWIKID